MPAKLEGPERAVKTAGAGEGEDTGAAIIVAAEPGIRHDGTY